jgi:uncharacterized small protein (DUF1192 family)
MEADDVRLGKAQITLGEPLDELSVSDLEERIVECEGEIARVRAELDRKRSGLSAAEAVFGKG